MNSKTLHTDDCRFFTAEDACRMALAAYYKASRTAEVYQRASRPSRPRSAPPLAPEREEGPGEALAEPLDRPWFLQQWMLALIGKLADDELTGEAYAEVIRRFDAEAKGEKITPENEPFATPAPALDNPEKDGADHA
jgi:hypothetical protein